MTNGALSALNMGMLGNTSRASQINSVTPVQSIKSAIGLDDTESLQANGDFASILKNAISGSLNNTQQLINSAEEAGIQFALGNVDNPHDLQIAQNKASVAMSYTVAVRDRLLEAYKEIMNMQV